MVERPSLYGRMADAYRAGLACVTERRPWANPHDGTSESAAERVLSVMWARGYQAGNPMARLPIADE